VELWRVLTDLQGGEVEAKDPDLPEDLLDPPMPANREPTLSWI
jgi:hypothetical protein